MNALGIWMAFITAEALEVSQERLGVWNFTVVMKESDVDAERIQNTLEEQTREAIVPLIADQNNIHLVTPENLQIYGPLPTGQRILETSKALELDYVITGKVHIGSKVDLVLKLYHVNTGSLLQQIVIQVNEVDDLSRKFPSTIDDLLVPVLQQNNPNSMDVIASFEAYPRKDTLLFVDGKVRCATLPCALKIKEGNHNIQFHNPYYEVWAKDLYIKPNAEIVTKLKSNFGLITIQSEPSGIQFEIDGVSMGKTPLEKHRIEQGEHEISILDPCYTGRDQTFTIKNKDSDKILLYGIPRQSGIEVYLENPTETANVYVDDVYLGKTPLSTNIAVCSQDLRVENKYGIFTDTLNLRESEVETLNIKLYKKQESKKKKGYVKKTDKKVSSVGNSGLKERRQHRSRRFNPDHKTWSTYTVQYGLETDEVKVRLGTIQIKSGWNKSFISPLLPGFRASLVDHSITNSSHQLLPIGLGYAFDVELGLVQPYYEWHWLSSNDPIGISAPDELYTQSTFTPHLHKFGLDFMLDNSPFSGGLRQYGSTVQLNYSISYCNDRSDPFCTNNSFVGASLYLMRGRWGE